MRRSQEKKGRQRRKRNTERRQAKSQNNRCCWRRQQLRAGPTLLNRKKKRKAPIRHRDEPMPELIKRQRITYDDEATEDLQVNHKHETCFFWYHGRCPRSLNPPNNYQCEYKHELSDPPSMVPPPPGYDHRTPCGLAWCAAEAKNTISDRQTSPTEGIPDSTGIEVGPHLQDQSYQQSGKSKKKVRRKGAKQTCFFWYHGARKRGS